MLRYLSKDDWTPAEVKTALFKSLKVVASFSRLSEFFGLLLKWKHLYYNSRCAIRNDPTYPLTTYKQEADIVIKKLKEHMSHISIETIVDKVFELLEVVDAVSPVKEDFAQILSDVNHVECGDDVETCLIELVLAAESVMDKFCSQEIYVSYFAFLNPAKEKIESLQDMFGRNAASEVEFAVILLLQINVYSINLSPEEEEQLKYLLLDASYGIKLNAKLTGWLANSQFESFLLRKRSAIELILESYVANAPEMDEGKYQNLIDCRNTLDRIITYLKNWEVEPSDHNVDEYSEELLEVSGAKFMPESHVWWKDHPLLNKK